ncbi:MAG: 50S ribosomal protein L9 [Candidatus Cloacimonetes bacterium]|nr:50S ribosomal protein L9 [Candidatus Cloacimonadota bacterium]
MELILTKDVPTLGYANEIVKVKPGYARNYLLPNNLAMVSSPAARKDRANKIVKAEEMRKVRFSNAEELADRLARISVDFTRKSSEEGKLFGSVTKEDIVTELKEKHLIEVDKKQLHLSVPVKTIGEFQVKIRLETGISGMLIVNVQAENHEELAAAAAEAEAAYAAAAAAEAAAAKEAEEAGE